MDYEKIKFLRDFVNENEKFIDKITLNHIERDFEITFSHESTKL